MFFEGILIHLLSAAKARLSCLLSTQHVFRKTPFYTSRSVHPILFHLGHLSFPTFGLLAALGLMAALSLALRCAPMVHLPPDTLWNITVFTAVAAFTTSRLLLIATNFRGFLSYPLLVLTLPSLTGIGLLLTGAATFVYLRARRISILDALDAWAAPATLLWGFLALGHLAEGSDPGLPSRAWWAVRVLPDPDLQQPVGLFAALVAIALTVVTLRHLRRRGNRSGTTASLALLLTGGAQFLLSFLRQPYPYAPDAPRFLLDPIQFLGMGMVAGPGLLYLIGMAPDHPGVGASGFDSAGG